MNESANRSIATIGMDIGKNTFHLIGLTKRGEIVLRQKWSRSQVEARLANIPPCLIGKAFPLGLTCYTRLTRPISVHDVRGLSNHIN